MIYTIEIPDEKVIGLEDVLAQANARNIQQRQPPFADMNAFLQSSIIATANQGLNSLMQAKSARIAQLMAEGKTLAEISAIVG